MTLMQVNNSPHRWSGNGDLTKTEIFAIAEMTWQHMLGLYGMVTGYRPSRATHKTTTSFLEAGILGFVCFSHFLRFNALGG